MPEGTIRVFLTTTTETGFADFVELDAGATIETLWRKQMGEQDPAKYVIRCNRAEGQVLPADFSLEEGDRITITPHKIDGAEAAGFAA
jgi:hypothetical protein